MTHAAPRGDGLLTLYWLLTRQPRRLEPAGLWRAGAEVVEAWRLTVEAGVRRFTGDPRMARKLREIVAGPDAVPDSSDFF